MCVCVKDEGQSSWVQSNASIHPSPNKIFSQQLDRNTVGISNVFNTPHHRSTDIIKTHIWLHSVWSHDEEAKKKKKKTTVILLWEICEDDDAEEHVLLFLLMLFLCWRMTHFCAHALSYELVVQKVDTLAAVPQATKNMRADTQRYSHS